MDFGEVRKMQMVLEVPVSQEGRNQGRRERLAWKGSSLTGQRCGEVKGATELPADRIPDRRTRRGTSLRWVMLGVLGDQR